MRRGFINLVLVVCLVVALSGSALAAVSYLGPAGTYTEEATVLYFGPGETAVPVATVAQSLAQLKAGECQYAVVPVENTIGGPVYSYLEAVVRDESFVIIGEVNLPIRQTLLGVPGATVADIKTVLSHPQGIAQSRDWLKANLPGVKVIEVSSTAEAARKVAELGDPSVAAIAASRTASVYSLDILATNLQYTDINVTRFWVVTLKQYQKNGKGKVALLVRGPIGKLPAFLADLDRKGYKVVTLHDLATKEKLGEYLFVVELAGGNPQDLAEQLAVKKPADLTVRVLGVYDSK